MRYSKQRELVLQKVEQLCDHPTAEEIYAEQHHGKVLHGTFLVLDQLHHLFFIHICIDHAAADRAVHVAVPAQRVVKAVRPARDAHPAHPPGIHKTVQVAVYCAKAQARAYWARIKGEKNI